MHEPFQNPAPARPAAFAGMPDGSARREPTACQIGKRFARGEAGVSGKIASNSLAWTYPRDLRYSGPPRDDIDGRNRRAPARVPALLNFPELDASIAVTGEVVWANREPPMDMGIRYVDLDEERKDTLRKYINMVRK